MCRTYSPKFVSWLLLLASLLCATATLAQTPPNVTVKVAVVDAELNVKPVPKFNLTAQPTDAAGNPESNAPPVALTTDFYQMALMCDGKEVTPIQRRKEELVVPMPSYLKQKNRYTFAGYYAYPYEIFAPGVCKELELRVFSEEKPTQPAGKILQSKTRQRVWDDFADYRQQKAIP